MVGVISVRHLIPTSQSAIMMSKYVGRNKVYWTCWAIWYIDISDVADTRIFFCLHLCGTKSLVQKSEPCFTFVPFGLGWDSDAAVLKVVCFWSSLSRFIGYQVFFSYRRYDLLRIAIKKDLYKTSANIYFQHFLRHHIAKTQII